MIFNKNDFLKIFQTNFHGTDQSASLPVSVGIRIFPTEILHQSFNIKKTFGKVEEEPGKRISNQLNFPKVIKHQLLYH